MVTALLRSHQRTLVVLIRDRVRTPGSQASSVCGLRGFGLGRHNSTTAALAASDGQDGKIMYQIEDLRTRLLALGAGHGLRAAAPAELDAFLLDWAIAGECHARTARPLVAAIAAQDRVWLLDRVQQHRGWAALDWSESVAAVNSAPTLLAESHDIERVPPLAAAHRQRLVSGLDARENWHRLGIVADLLGAGDVHATPDQLSAADQLFESIAEAASGVVGSCYARLAELPEDVSDGHWWYWMPIHAAMTGPGGADF